MRVFLALLAIVFLASCAPPKHAMRLNYMDGQVVGISGNVNEAKAILPNGTTFQFRTETDGQVFLKSLGRIVPTSHIGWGIYSGLPANVGDETNVSNNSNSDGSTASVGPVAGGNATGGAANAGALSVALPVQTTVNTNTPVAAIPIGGAGLVGGPGVQINNP